MKVIRLLLEPFKNNAFAKSFAKLCIVGVIFSAAVLYWGFSEPSAKQSAPTSPFYNEITVSEGYIVGEIGQITPGIKLYRLSLNNEKEASFVMMAGEGHDLTIGQKVKFRTVAFNRGFDIASFYLPE